MVLLAAFEVMLHKHSRQTDLLVGTPVRGRTQPQTENLLGFFVNTLVIRSRLDTSNSFNDLLTQVRSTLLDAFSHEDMPFELLVERLKVPRDLSRSPIYQAFFSFQSATDRSSQIGDLSLVTDDTYNGSSATDLCVWAKETSGGLVCRIDFSTDLFDAETIGRFRDQFRALLRQLPDVGEEAIRDLEILPEPQRALLARWSDPSHTAVPSLDLVALFEGSAVDEAKIAIEVGPSRINYGDLHRRSNQLARALVARGLGRGALVGLCVERSIEMVLGLLGDPQGGGNLRSPRPPFPGRPLGVHGRGLEDGRVGDPVEPG